MCYCDQWSVGKCPCQIPNKLDHRSAHLAGKLPSDYRSKLRHYFDCRQPDRCPCLRQRRASVSAFWRDAHHDSCLQRGGCQCRGRPDMSEDNWTKRDEGYRNEKRSVCAGVQRHHGFVSSIGPLMLPLYVICQAQGMRIGSLVLSN